MVARTPREGQNRTRQSGNHGQLIRNHQEGGTKVHLFVRKASKLPGKGSAPFLYCGDVAFEGWEGEKPIAVRWGLAKPVPGRLQEELRVSQQPPPRGGIAH